MTKFKEVKLNGKFKMDKKSKIVYTKKSKKDAQADRLGFGITLGEDQIVIGTSD